MVGFKYQLKNMLRDKMCILTFLLPVIAGLAIRLLSGVSLTAVNTNMFGVLKEDLAANTVQWLENYGDVTSYADMEGLETAVKDPSTQMIGVLRSENGIAAMLAGDELQLYEVTGNTLPQLYEERGKIASFEKHAVPRESSSDGMQSLLIVITMVTAMFMGCTFNAMNIIGEKEDGIEYINEILPMTTAHYIIQKMMLGFLGGVLSTAVTALVCIQFRPTQMIPLVLLIMLSAFIAAQTGMFIGQLSNGMMTGIVYIKVIMILFLAPPVLFYLTVSPGSIGHTLSLLIPSSAAFYGLMEMQGGQTQNLWSYVTALMGHCLVWTTLSVLIISRRLPHHCK